MQRSSSQLFWGFLLLGLGAALLLVRLGVYTGSLWGLWPLFVLAMGLWRFVGAVRKPDGRGLTSAAIILAVGAFFLAERFDRVDESFFLPILIVSVGFALVLRVAFYGRR